MDQYRGVAGIDGVPTERARDEYAERMLARGARCTRTTAGRAV
jgi:hypothetical protein